jgi:uncharacterized protein YuzE
MTLLTYDPEADAVHITLALAKAERTKIAGPLLYELDAKGRIVGIEIRPASNVLADGIWKKARRPKGQRSHVAERHQGFLFIRRFSPRDVESR